jgi:hypothetical protein
MNVYLTDHLAIKVTTDYEVIQNSDVLHEQ